MLKFKSMTQIKVLALMIAFAMFFTMSMPLASFASAKANDIQGHWAEATITNMINANVISGYPDGSFKPNANISRAEFAALIVKAFNLRGTSGKVFNDTAEHWAKDAIATAYQYGIVNGYSDTEFGPGDPITREQAAVMIVKATILNNAANLNFSDADQISSWAQKSVQIAVSAGLFSGYPDGTFKPQGNTTRAEAASILYKYFAISEQDIEVKPIDDEIIDDKISNIFDEAGIYGPKRGTETIEDNVIVTADGVSLQNLIITGNLTIAEAVADGDVSLINVSVEGNTYIKGGGENTVRLEDCSLNKVTVNKKNNKIRILLKNTKIKHLIADSGVKVEGSGTITDLTINVNDVEVQPKPVNKPTIKSGVTAKVAGETLRGNVPGGGGPGPGPETSANVGNADQLNTALANSNITTITFTASFAASPTINRSLTMNFGAHTLTGNLNFNHTGTGTSVLNGNAGNRITGNLTVDTQNASFNNGVGVSGTVTIANVAAGSWTESANGNTLTITDPDGATITIVGNPGSVTVTPTAGGGINITVNPGASIEDVIIQASNVSIVNATGIGHISSTQPVNIDGDPKVAGDYYTISSTSTITNGAVNPTLTIASKNFKAGIATGDFNVSAGSTGLTLASVTRTSAEVVTLNFTGTAAAGNLSIQARNTAFDPVGAANTNTLTVNVPAPVPGTTAVIFKRASGLGMPTSQIKVQIDGSFVNNYTLYFDGSPLATTTNGIVTIATAVTTDLTRVQIHSGGSLRATSDGGTW